LPPTKADQNTSVAWQLSWFKPNGNCWQKIKYLMKQKKTPIWTPSKISWKIRFGARKCA